MLGGIYTRQRCPACGKKLVDNGFTACACPDHPENTATQHEVRFSGGVSGRFRSYEEAAQFLNGLRFKHKEGTFDPRDYQKGNPLGFANLAGQWLEHKKPRVKWSSYRNLRSYLFQAIDYFNEKGLEHNIKAIKKGHYEDFLWSMSCTDKTRSNARSALHDFLSWLKDREIVKDVPQLPHVEFTLKMSKTIGKDTQRAILHEVCRISQHNRKIGFGIKLLCTYIAIRPNELRRLKESDIDLEQGILFFPDPKEKKPKEVPICWNDVELFREFGVSDQVIPFFRHEEDGHIFNKNLLYEWWKRACKGLGVEGVDLYRGTRHSSARALRSHLSPESVKRMAGHSTNAAFERYFWLDQDDLRDRYELSQPAKELPKDFEGSKKCKVLKFKG